MLVLFDSLAGCGSLQQAAPGGSMSRSQSATSISRAAKGGERFAFISDYNLGAVYILALPHLTLTKTIGGLKGPLGECSGSKGNVYVVESGTSRVIEYSHAGAQIATFNDSYGQPMSCAVNPRNGDLAVTDDGGGGVLVYTGSSSSPTSLRNPKQDDYAFVGYNPRNQLWVDGGFGNAFVLSRCGPSSCTTVKTQGGEVYRAGAIQWDERRRTWVVFDQSCENSNPGACSYPVSEKGVFGVQTFYDNSKGSSVCLLTQGALDAESAGFVVGGDHDTCGGKGDKSIYRWSYPHGGKPTDHYTLPYGAFPYGSAISEQ